MVKVDNDIMVLANPEIARLPNWVIALVAAGGIAAALSTAAGLLLAISSAISHDLLKGMFMPNISEKNELMAGRIAMAVAIVVAGFLGLNPPGFAAQVVALAFGLAASSIFPAIMMGIFNRRMNKEGAIAGMLVGLLSTLVYIFWFKGWFFVKGTNMAPDDAAALAAGHLAGFLRRGRCLLNFAVAWVVSKMTPPPPEHIRRWSRTSACRRAPRGRPGTRLRGSGVRNGAAGCGKRSAALDLVRCRTPTDRRGSMGIGHVRRRVPAFLLPAAISVLLPGVRGQVLAEEPSAPAGQHDVVVELGAGVIRRPDWEGAEDPGLAPWLIFDLRYLSVGPLTVGGSDRDFSIGPDLSFVGGRDDRTDARPRRTWSCRCARWSSVSRRRIASDHSRRRCRRGADSADTAVSSANHPWSPYCSRARHAEISAGPELTFAGDDYMDTYFSVSDRAVGSIRSRSS